MLAVFWSFWHSQVMANHLPSEKKALVIAMLAEDSSIRAIERTTGINRNTIMNLGVRVGNACGQILDAKLHGLNCRHIEVDEIWGIIGNKRKNATAPVHEVFRGQTAWEGNVEGFDLKGHHKANRAYAWSEKTKSGERFFAVLETPRIKSALDAVKASIVADSRRARRSK